LPSQDFRAWLKVRTCFIPHAPSLLDRDRWHWRGFRRAPPPQISLRVQAALQRPCTAPDLVAWLAHMALFLLTQRRRGSPSNADTPPTVPATHNQAAEAAV
jgi:hypothetical protein